MNNLRRIEIQKILDKLNGIHNDLEHIKEQEQEYIDNMPENLQGSSRAEQSQNCLDNIEYAVDNIQEAIDNLNSSIE